MGATDHRRWLTKRFSGRASCVAERGRSADCSLAAASRVRQVLLLSGWEEERISRNAKNQGHPWALSALLHQLRLQSAGARARRAREQHLQVLARADRAGS